MNRFRDSATFRVVEASSTTCRLESMDDRGPKPVNDRSILGSAIIAMALHHALAAVGRENRVGEFARRRSRARWRVYVRDFIERGYRRCVSRRCRHHRNRYSPPPLVASYVSRSTARNTTTIPRQVVLAGNFKL